VQSDLLRGDAGLGNQFRKFGQTIINVGFEESVHFLVIGHSAFSFSSMA
jgi:hypothetical protein